MKPEDLSRLEASRARLLLRLDEGWRAWLVAVAAVSGDAVADEPVVERWTLRDLINHVTSWEQEFLKALPIILAGERLPRYSDLYGGIDAFNAREFERARELSPAQIRLAAAETHALLVETVSGLPGGGAVEREATAASAQRYVRALSRARGAGAGAVGEAVAALRAIWIGIGRAHVLSTGSGCYSKDFSGTLRG